MPTNTCAHTAGLQTKSALKGPEGEHVEWVPASDTSKQNTEEVIMHSTATKWSISDVESDSESKTQTKRSQQPAQVKSAGH